MEDDRSKLLSSTFLLSVAGREVELHKRMKTACEFLLAEEQLPEDAGQPVYLEPLAQQLINPALLKHRNGVRPNATLASLGVFVQGHRWSGCSENCTHVQATARPC